jgi:hypothetical protein
MSWPECTALANRRLAHHNGHHAQNAMLAQAGARRRFTDLRTRRAQISWAVVHAKSGHPVLRRDLGRLAPAGDDAAAILVTVFFQGVKPCVISARNDSCPAMRSVLNAPRSSALRLAWRNM